MTRNRKYYLFVGLLFAISLLLIACSGSNIDQPETGANTNSENQVALPAIDSSNPAEDIYPAPAEAAQPEAYPQPAAQAEMDAYPATEAQTQNTPASEPYPTTEEISVKPTPRGNDLAATDPSTVSLASGEVQLVEMFAFW